MKFKRSGITLLQLSKLRLLSHHQTVTVTKYCRLSFSFHQLLSYLLAFCFSSAFYLPASVIFLLVSANVDCRPGTNCRQQVQKHTSNFSFWTELTKCHTIAFPGSSARKLYSILGPFLHVFVLNKSSRPHQFTPSQSLRARRGQINTSQYWRNNDQSVPRFRSQNQTKQLYLFQGSGLIRIYFHISLNK